MYYIIWFDDSKGTPADKIKAGVQAYRDRFGVAPAYVYVNERDMTAVEGVQVQLGTEAGNRVAPNNFWIGPVAGVAQ